ncbi:MAG: acyl-CoA dehydrogenase family protein [Janthinobacterium lividum]
MDFQLSDEQRMLQDSARRFLADHCAFEDRSALVAQGSFDLSRWQQFAEQGWLGMGIAEDYDGLGGTPIETALLMEEMGRVLFVEPFWAVAVLAAQTIAAAGDDAHAQVLLPLIASGEGRPVLAHNEVRARGVIEFVATTARADAGGWRLNGQKSLVIGGNAADSFIVSARTSGAEAQRHGISLFVVPRDVPGLVVRDFRLIDNRWCAELDLHDVAVSEVELLGTRDQGFAALDAGHAHALIGLCAEALGVMERALWVTRDYLKTRKQFGVTLNTFQALQHRMSEMLIELELTRGMVHRGLASMHLPTDERARALSATKIHVGRSGRFVCGQAIQLHGGIGVAEEYLIGHHFKRMTTIESALGSSHVHLERLAEHERRVADDLGALAG